MLLIILRIIYLYNLQSCLVRVKCLLHVMSFGNTPQNNEHARLLGALGSIFKCFLMGVWPEGFANDITLSCLETSQREPIWTDFRQTFTICIALKKPKPYSTDVISHHLATPMTLGYECLQTCFVLQLLTTQGGGKPRVCTKGGVVPQNWFLVPSPHKCAICNNFLQGSPFQGKRKHIRVLPYCPLELRVNWQPLLLSWACVPNVRLLRYADTPSTYIVQHWTASHSHSLSCSYSCCGCMGFCPFGSDFKKPGFQKLKDVAGQMFQRLGLNWRSRSYYLFEIFPGISVKRSWEWPVRGFWNAGVFPRPPDTQVKGFGESILWLGSLWKFHLPLPNGPKSSLNYSRGVSRYFQLITYF